jgi:hypothetical protein
VLLVCKGSKHRPFCLAVNLRHALLWRLCPGTRSAVFLKSGWYENDSYSSVLPNLQRAPQKDPLPELSSHTFKTVTPRPYSAEICRRRRVDLAAEPFCRIRPLPVKTYRPDTHHDREKQTSDRTKAGLVPIEVVDSPFFRSCFL